MKSVFFNTFPNLFPNKLERQRKPVLAQVDSFWTDRATVITLDGPVVPEIHLWGINKLIVK